VYPKLVPDKMSRIAPELDFGFDIPDRGRFHQHIVHAGGKTFFAIFLDGARGHRNDYRLA